MNKIITLKWKREYIIITIFLSLLIIVIFMYGYFNYTKEEEVINDDIMKVDVKEEVDKIYVDIKGQVNKPGVYEIKKDSTSTVSDLINISGGLTVEADTSYLNMALKLKDEMVIIIYSKQEIEEFKKGNVTVVNLEKCVCPSITNDGCLKEDKTITNKKNDDKVSKDNNKIININTATLEELQTLTGIGPSKADDIIKYREKNNGFKSIEELKEVKGIGDAIFIKIKSLITI